MRNERSLIKLLDNYTLVDLETTGCNKKYDAIIEMTAIKIRNNDVVDIYTTLINPLQEIPPYIVDLTGITNDTVKNHQPIQKHIKDLIDFIGNDIVVGHNISFDLNFINYNYSKTYGVNFTPKYVDTLRMARKLLKHLSHHRLDDLINEFNINIENRHRSKNDALATMQSYNNLCKLAIDEYGDELNFVESFKRNNNANRFILKASKIQPETSEFDETHPVYNMCFAFTGTLEKYPRRIAMQKVVNLGGIVGDGVTKNTDYLVVGDLDYSKFVDGEKSSKMKKAEKMMIDGHHIRILSETTFYDLIEE